MPTITATRTNTGALDDHECRAEFARESRTECLALVNRVFDRLDAGLAADEQHAILSLVFYLVDLRDGGVTSALRILLTNPAVSEN